MRMFDRQTARLHSSLRAVTAAALLAAGAAAFPALAENFNAALDEPRAMAIEEAIVAAEADAVDMLKAIGGIVSPSGAEHDRAEKVAAIMRDIGLSDVKVTDAPNVIGRIAGRSGKSVVFISTLDDLKTVAEHQRESGEPLKRKGDRVEGPGSNTSSATVAMLIAARALLESGDTPEHSLVFAAVAQEETGLNGMKALYDSYKNEAVAFIDILGDGSSISYGAIGIHWWRIIAEGPAGHTLHGGLPNVNQAVARAVDSIFSLPHPQRYADRNTRINIAILNSGSVFNHKPDTAWFSLDIRSVDNAVIADAESDVRAILQKVGSQTDIALRMEPVSRTPGGQIPGARESRLVLASIAVARRIGLTPTLSDSGSANLNIAIANGSLAIGLGGERGGRRGFSDEWADIPAMMRASMHVGLLGYLLAADSDKQ